ncbi:beta-hexosaminidase [Hysterangium stoloniferum]|nr:beta-hexosaminidase [Hysterangium stoloniferum]
MVHFNLIPWLTLAALLAPSSVAGLWPAPTELSTGNTVLRLGTLFKFHPRIKKTPRDLKAAMSRSRAFLFSDKLQMLVPDRGANYAHAVKAAKVLTGMILSLEDDAVAEAIADEATKPIKQRDERYTLTIPSDGGPGTLTAKTTLGLYRGLTTFEQLWYDVDGLTFTTLAPITIHDAPAFPYRGLMLDTARNYFPVDSILSTLDAMSYVKMNIFHWHIVDSQSFPLEVAAFPELSAGGAYTTQSVYTQRDVQKIVSYASARGIDIMVELDTPGHTSSIAESHPEFIACHKAMPWNQFANGMSTYPPAGQLRIADDDVINFVSALFTSVASQFPSKFFSTGGDEINQNCYAQDSATQRQLDNNKQTFEQALFEFTRRTHKVLTDLGKTPVVWEEMVLEHNLNLDNGTAVLVWISSEHAALVAGKGYDIIQAPSDYFYLDCGAGGWVGNDVSRNSWCDPFKTWQKAYSYDPFTNLTTEQQKLVLGGQQLLWAEQSGPQNLESIVWPRAAASAEVFWTGAVASGRPRDVVEALPRLHDLRYRMVQRGIDAINLQPMWCALRSGECDSEHPKEEIKQVDDSVDTEDFISFFKGHVQTMLSNYFDPFGEPSREL